MGNISHPSILTVDEAAQYLRVTVDELNLELTSRHIPALKIAGTWRIKRDALDKLLEPSIFENNKNLGLGDLYSSTLPVSGHKFFGREKWLRQLSDLVQQGQFFGIYGLRKMGKTSLIYQLSEEKLRGEAVAYVDLQASPALTEKNCAPIYWELEHALYNRLHDKEATDLLSLAKVKRFSDLPHRGANAGLIFNEDLRALLEAMSAGKTKFNKLVIVLDELEHILPIAGQEGVRGYLEFFGLLRGLAQRYRGLLSSIVVAANSALSERGYWEGKENPVFALYKPHFLSPLSKDDCVEMIRSLGKGMSVYWEDNAIETVFSETNGHPFITRLLCSRIAKRNSERPLTVTVDKVQEEVPSFVRDEGDKLEQITKLLNSHFPDEETLLEQIALDEAPTELQDSALSHLLRYQLISSEQGKYQVSFNLLRRWLRRRAGIKE
ncbi:MAG: excisionase family DNA-binding protein [Pseudomonadota bacterium]